MGAIAVAVSGGADSLLALALLREAGHDVAALHGLFFESGADGERLERIGAACKKLRVEFRAVDLRDAFRRKVVDPFVQDYARGLTPNPCASCNREIKFGLLLDAALDLGADRLATGHYVRTDQSRTGRLRLLRGVDSRKDQSYFLSLVPAKRLERAIFPLGESRKENTLDELRKRNIEPPLPQPSKDICFVAGDDYRRFLEASGACLPGPGPIVLEDGRRIGTHRGLWRHTPGQRRGLGASWSEPLYVLELDFERNALVAGPASSLANRACEARGVNVLRPFEEWPEETLARIRYNQQPKPAGATLRDGALHIRFHESAGVPAPGQLAVAYDRDEVLAGGVIVRPDRQSSLASNPQLD
jgi:tRNA-specific 2-thiouridylase